MKKTKLRIEFIDGGIDFEMQGSEVDIVQIMLDVAMQNDSLAKMIEGTHHAIIHNKKSKMNNMAIRVFATIGYHHVDGTLSTSEPCTITSFETWVETVTFENKNHEPDYFFDKVNECKEGWNNPRKLKLNSVIIKTRQNQNIRNQLPRKLRFD